LLISLGPRSMERWEAPGWKAPEQGSGGIHLWHHGRLEYGVSARRGEPEMPL
jgi:hypothetical protein